MLKKISKENSHYVGLLILATTGLSSVLGFLYWFIAARILDATEVGIAGGIVPGIGIVALVSSGGIGPVVLVVKEKLTRSFLKKLLIIITTLNILASFIVALTLLTTETRYLDLVLLLLAGGVATSFSLVIDSILLGYGKVYSFFIKNLTVSLSKIILILVVPVYSATGLVTMWVLPLILATMIFLVYTYFLVSSGVTSKISEVYSLKNWVSSHISVLLAQVTVFVLPIIVLTTQGSDANASFYVALLLASASLMIPPAFSNSYLAKNFDNMRQELQTLRSKYIIVLLLQVVAISTVVAIGDFLLESLGEGYSNSKLVLGVLLLAGIPNTFITLNIGFLRKKHELTKILKLNATTTIITISLGLSLSSLGVLYVALSFLLGQLIGCGYSLVLKRRTIKEIVGMGGNPAQSFKNWGEND